VSGGGEATVGQAADRLIGRLGSDDAAADALIIAMDLGYSGPQILDAVELDMLLDDGTIDGQTPAGPPLSLVAYDLIGEGEGAAGPGDAVHRLGEVRLASMVQGEQVPIERLRDNARRQGVLTGEKVTLAIMSMLKVGFTPGDIIEVLILGADDLTRDARGAVDCYLVVDEWYCANGVRRPASETDAAGQPDDAGTDDSALDDSGEQDSAPPGLRTWEGEWEIVDEIEVATTVDETSIRIEELPDGSFAWNRETLVTHTVRPGSVPNPCSYVSIETSSLTAEGVGPGDRLRFRGTRVVEYLTGSECFEFGGPEAGTFDDGAGGTLVEDTISLDRFWDGVSPTILTDPATG